MSADNVPEVPPPVLRLSLEIVGTHEQLVAGWAYVTEWIDPDDRELAPGFSLRAGPIVLDVSLVDERPTDG